MEPSESLHDQLNADFAPTWNAQIGEELIGEITAIDQRRSAYDQRRYPILTVRRDRDGEEFAVHASSAQLRERIAQAAPSIGERIGIKRLEDGEGGRGAYKRWRVVMERSGDAIDWKQFSDDAPPAESPAPAAERDSPAPVGTDLHRPLSEEEDIPF